MTFKVLSVYGKLPQESRMAYGKAPAECEDKGFQVYYLPNERKVAALMKYQFICDVVLHIQIGCSHICT